MLLLWPVATVAAPAPVQGVNAANVDGNAQITWQAVEGATSYRIYYSSQSILENSGVYDDFVDTNSPATEYMLDGSLLANKVFVTVLAVDANGVESTVFLEEASTLLTDATISDQGVTIEATEPREQSTSSVQADNTLTVVAPTQKREGAPSANSSAAAIPEWQAPVNDGQLHLLIAEAATPNEVLLQFNVFPTVDAEGAPNAFSIVDGNGKALRIRGIYIQNEFISVQTDTQVANESYQIRLSEPLMALDGGSLDEVDRKMVFRGHAEDSTRKPAVAVSTSSAATSPNTVASSSTEYQPTIPQQQCNPADVASIRQVSGLRLHATQQVNGNYTVHVNWNFDVKNCEDYLRYIVRQSRDRGRTFSNPQMIPVTIAGLEIPNATPGEYGVGIAVMNAQGYVSQEVFESIMLPGARSIPTVQPAKPAAPQQPMQANVVQTPRSNFLASTGAGLFAVGTISVSLAGAIWRRRSAL